MAAVELGEHWPHWDYNAEIKMYRDVQIEAAAVREQCRLAGDRDLRIAVTWRCTSTQLRGLAFSQSVPTEERVFLRLGITLPSRELGGVVSVRTQLVPGATLTEPERMAPAVAGSIVWEDEKVLRLEGAGPRFPVEFVDFAQTRLPNGAGWFLDWNSEDLGAPVLSSLRLLINSSHAAVASAASSPGLFPGDREIQSAIRADVMRSMILGALANAEFVEGPDAYEEGSVGREVRRLIRTLFGDEFVSSLSERARHSPDEFMAELQDKAQLFH